MTVHALADPLLRRAAKAGGPRRKGKRPEAGPAHQLASRNGLIADYLALCELDPAVEGLKAPAEPAEFVIGGETIHHRADFEVLRDGQTLLVDVVTDADLAVHPLRTAAVGGAAAEDGRLFAIETAYTIRAEPRFTTVKLIQACKRTPVSAGDRVRILHHLDECGTAALVEVAGVVQNSMDGVAAVLALAVEGLVAVEIERPILPETPVRRRKAAASEY